MFSIYPNLFSFFLSFLPPPLPFSSFPPIFLISSLLSPAKLPLFLLLRSGQASPFPSPPAALFFLASFSFSLLFPCLPQLISSSHPFASSIFLLRPLSPPAPSASQIGPTSVPKSNGRDGSVAAHRFFLPLCHSPQTESLLPPLISFIRPSFPLNRTPPHMYSGPSPDPFEQCSKNPPSFSSFIPHVSQLFPLSWLIRYSTSSLWKRKLHKLSSSSCSSFWLFGILTADVANDHACQGFLLISVWLFQIIMQIVCCFIR